MNEIIEQCILCDNSELIELEKIKDHFATKEYFEIKSCKQCHTRYTSPRPDSNDIITYYKSSSYISHGQSKGFFFDLLYKAIQKLTFRQKRKILEKYTLSKNHLDFGCGTGTFINYLAAKNWNSTGIEPDKDARSIASKNSTVQFLSSLDQLDSESTYNSISLFHVLEHVHTLTDTLNHLINLLDRNGILLLALPNFKSHDAIHYGTNWAGYDVPRHLYHFSQHSIHQLAKKFGLNIVATHPMKFDSYYVSLLSEQYRAPTKIPYIKAIIKGYQSNSKAKRTGEYSSLIYILSK